MNDKYTVNIEFKSVLEAIIKLREVEQIHGRTPKYIIMSEEFCIRLKNELNHNLNTLYLNKNNGEIQEIYSLKVIKTYSDNIMILGY